MEQISREQFKTLRKQGFSQDQIRDLSKRGKVYETLNKKTFKQKGLLRATGEFLGMEEFGRGIGTAASNALGTQDAVIDANERGSAVQTSLLKRIKEKKARGEDVSRLQGALTQLGSDIQQTGSQVSEIGTQGLSNREVLGSAAQTGLSVIGLRGGIPTASGAAKALGTSKALGGAVVGAVSGGLSGAAEAVTEGKNVLGGAATGAALGGAIGGTLGKVSDYVDDLAGRNPKSRITDMKSELKTVQRAFDKNSRYVMKNGERQLVTNPIDTIVDYKLTPKVANGKVDATSSLESLSNKIAQLDEEATDMISTASEKNLKVPVRSFRDAVLGVVETDDAIKAQGKIGTARKQVASIFDDYVESYGDEMTVEQLNNIRVQMNKVFDPTERDVSRRVGDAARRFVYEQVPDAQLLLQEEGTLIGARNFLEALDKKAVTGGKLGRYFADMVGAMAGANATEGFVGPIVGAAGGRQVANFTQSQFFNPVTGRVARTVVSAVDDLPVDPSGNVSKTAVMNLIGQLVNQSDQQ